MPRSQVEEGCKEYMGHEYLTRIREEEREECIKLLGIGEDARLLNAPFAVENAGEHAEGACFYALKGPLSQVFLCAC